MLGFLSTVWNGLLGFVGMILPFSQEARQRRLSPAVRWGLHIAAVAVILLVLYLLNAAFRVDLLIPGSTILKTFWLPILFLLSYSLAWLGWWLWKLLAAEEASHFPDIDAAWDEAVAALAHAHIRPADLPLFLVLGRPEGPDGLNPGERGRKAEEILFHQTANLNLVVKQTPASPAPLHVYASRDGLFVTCAESSLLGRLAAMLTGEVSGGPETSPLGSGADGDAADKTLRPDAAPKPVRDMVGIVRRIARQGGQGTEEDQRMLRRLERQSKPRASLLQDQATVAELTARLRHLCRLIARDRAPYCPVNGVLILVPLAATDTEEDTQTAADALALDLRAARDALKINCPQFAMVCDSETASGFRVFVQRQDVKDRQRRVGQRFPLGTELRGQALLDAMDGSVRWLCNNVMREWVYRLFKTEASRDEQGAAVGDNARLFLLLDEMRERDARLSRILTRGIAAEAAGPVRFGGCYLGATGADATQQAFVAGVFRRLIESQDAIAWTAEAKEDDAKAHRSATTGYLVVGLFWVAVVGYIAWSLMGPGRQS